ncbi:MAG: type III-A CRISPR-associated protein Csm2 [Methanobacteriaceae archaeon]|jgi:CRISPR-associated protein Csm2|nr:type III-A CRISPR-associated protein Csm2 [Candidatus Methanorudis spinitermitis]
MADRRNDSNRDRTMDNIIMEIDRLNSLSELKPKKYADEKGYADRIAKHFSKGRDDSEKLNSNQLRKFFGAIRDIESKDEDWEEIEPQFYLLKPKLAVSVGRKLIPRDFHRLMMVCMSKIDIGNNEHNFKNFKVFVNFLEAIVAYSKYHNPK